MNQVSYTTTTPTLIITKRY